MLKDKEKNEDDATVLYCKCFRINWFLSPQTLWQIETDEICSFTLCRSSKYFNMFRKQNLMSTWKGSTMFTQLKFLHYAHSSNPPTCLHSPSYFFLLFALIIFIVSIVPFFFSFSPSVRDNGRQRERTFN